MATYPIGGTVTSDMPFLRVRDAANGVNIVAYLLNGLKVELLAEVLDTKGRKWYQVQATRLFIGVYNDEALIEPREAVFRGWCAGWLITPVGVITPPPPVTPPPPPVTGHGAPWLGVNTIVSASSALDAAAKGCRAFLIIDNEMLCRQIKRAHPEAVVVARRWIAGSIKPNGDRLANLLGGADDNVIYETLNEADNWPYGTVDQIRNRIDIELRATELMRTKGIKVCMGGYSMGTPGFVLKDGSPDMDIINQVKRYAAVYNSDPGVFFSMHLYSPNMNRVGAMDKWYELRYQWLFTHCGFDPTLRKIISTEGGVDQGGIGGMPAHNATTEQFNAWCKAYQDAVSNSPLLATMIFQYSQHTSNKWAGYEIAPWIGSLQSRGWK